MNGGWPAGRNLLFLLPWVWFLSCPGLQTFWGILQNSWFLGSVITAGGLTANQSLGGEKNYTVYSLFFMFIIIFIIVITSTSISSSISISFVILLNHLYLNPQVSFFVHFSSPPCWGQRGGVSEQLLGPSCWLLG